jgi:hypothetical protein
MDQTKIHKKKGYKPDIIALLMLILTFLFPTSIIILSHPENEFAAYIIAATWMIFLGSPIPTNGGGSSMPPTVNPYNLFQNFPITIVRLIFVFLMYRYFQGKTSKTYVFLIGIISEIVPIWLSLPTIISPTQLLIPLPILFPVGLILIYAIKPDKVLGPWEGKNESTE